MTAFVVGIPRRIPLGDILADTFDAISRSTILPSCVIVVDNGALPLPTLLLGVEVIRPRANLGCASSWNLLRKLSAPESIVLLNDDCAVAPDTFEKMYAHPEPIVCAYGFACVRIDSEAWEKIGGFDEGFFPAYFEDADFRYRAELAGVPICEWGTYPREKIADGRERSAQGIVHGKPEPDEYKIAEFKARVEANKARYVEKWGGAPGCEKFLAPFGAFPVIPLGGTT